MISRLILQHLVHSKEYWRKVLPYIKPDYFSDPAEKITFETLSTYIQKYGGPPSLEALQIEVDRAVGSNQLLAEQSSQVVDSLGVPNDLESMQWLVDRTEEFCQDQAIQNSLRKSIEILDGRDKKLGKGAIPQLLQDALSVCFDASIGHDYYDDWKARFDEYHRIESQIPFDIAYLNKITDGGLRKKTLFAWMAPSGVGKSIMMCHMAAAHLSAGYNVMYISCEMSEYRLAERIDMNLMDYTSHDLRNTTLEVFQKKLERNRERSKNGKLIFKEYPTSTIGVPHVRHLLNEAKTKKGFVPDVLYVDYLNIMISARIKQDGNNGYAAVKAIAEELRGVAVEYNIPIVTATQVNRGGYNNSDIDMTNTSESMGLVHTLDYFLAMISTEELSEQNQILIKQLKNRYRDENMDRKFVIGLDKSKMRLFDLEESAQKGLQKDPEEKTVKKQGLGQRKDFSSFS